MPTAIGPPSRTDVAFAALRVGVGVLFLIFAEYKVFGTAFTHGDFQGWINGFITSGSTYPFMVPILRVVLAHATPMAYLVSYGELAIGLALTFGVLSRVASVCGVIYMVTLLVSSNYPGADMPMWRYFGASLDHLVLAMCFAAFVIGDPDRIFSVRRYVWRRA